MRVLLDTNILIHREASAIIRDDIGDLFLWLDRIHAQKCIHPHSIEEIRKHRDSDVVRSFEAKLRSYAQLRTVARDTPTIDEIRQSDRTTNDIIDTDLLREVVAGRVDLLLSEDRHIHAKAEQLGIASCVKRIDSFLEQIVREHPELVEYNVLAVRKEYFGNVDVSDSFFDSFRHDYPNFERWFNRKADEIAYTCRDDEGRILAFLYLKTEGPDEPYSDIFPAFSPKYRLKIGTFKTVLNGYKIGERFLKIVFDNALQQSIDEIYLTIFDHTPEHDRLINLISQWGFSRYGDKISDGGEESVWVRPFVHQALRDHPAATYPFISREAPKFIVPIYPEYHTELLPDSILRTESPMDFVENRPNRNAIRKAYISRSHFRDLHSGDIIVFYRTGSGTAPAHYTSVATTIGVIESVHLALPDFESFRTACENVTVFGDKELRQHWDYYPRNRPFVVKFLSVYSLPERPNLSEMKGEGILLTHPRGFEPITDRGFYRLLEIANATDCPIVN
jgi:predicted nucleic acid-binding protein